MVFPRYIAPVPVRKIGWGRGRTGLHTLVTISATAIMNLSCDLPSRLDIQTIAKFEAKGGKKKKKILL